MTYREECKVNDDDEQSSEPENHRQEFTRVKMNAHIFFYGKFRHQPQDLSLVVVQL